MTFSMCSTDDQKKKKRKGEAFVIQEKLIPQLKMKFSLKK